MIVRTLDDANRTDRRVISPDGNWESCRLILRDDRMGFSFHVTTIYAGKSFRLHYTHHLESVYCMEGTGSIQSLETGESFDIHPGTVYALDQHDPHILTAKTELRLACVFNPPVVGNEVHRADGSYAPDEEAID
jgi:L-ectoine synthase